MNSLFLNSFIQSSSLRSSLPRLMLALTAALLGACSVSLRSDVENDVTQNSCQSSDQCGAGFCRSGLCQIGSSELSTVLLSVTPPAGTPTIAGIEFTSVIEVAPNSYGFPLQLGNVSRLEGKVTGVELTGDNCLPNPELEVATAAADGSLPVRVTFTPRGRLLGLPSPPHTVKVEEPVKIANGSYQFDLNMPPGSYDIYFEPLTTDGGCIRPPYLVVDRELLPGIVDLTMQLPVPEFIRVKVRYPKITDDLREFTVDIIERDSGRLLSNRARLGEPVQTDVGLEYAVDLAFSEVQGGPSARAAELVRLSPPDSVTAPILYIERSVIDLFQGDGGLIDQLTEIPDPVSFTSRVTIAGSPDPADATVSIIATELQSTNPGTVAAFRRTVETDEQGYFQVDLLPGTYRITAEPFDSEYASTAAEFSVSGSSATQIGKTIEIKKRSEIRGSVATFEGTSVFGAPLWAGAEPFDTVENVLATALGQVPTYPTAVGTTSDSKGGFVIPAESGFFRVVARPQEGSGFPWRVRLGVDTTNGHADLGRMILSLPLVLTGLLTSQDLLGEAPNGIVPDGLIRAYAFIGDGDLVASRDEADSVIAVAEARADSEGRFRLLLPSVFK